jgi:hypothetical protein
MIFKNSDCTAKETQHFTIAKINCLTLFKEIIRVYNENHTKLVDMKCVVIAKQLVQATVSLALKELTEAHNRKLNKTISQTLLPPQVTAYLISSATQFPLQYLLDAKG